MIPVLQDSELYKVTWDVPLEKQIIIHRGGTRSGKSFTLIHLAMVWLFTGQAGKYIPKVEHGVFSILRKYRSSHTQSVYRDFLNELYKYGLAGQVESNKTEKTFSYGGRTVEFIGCDDSQKIRSANRELLWCEEANEIAWDDFFQASIRTSIRVFISFNPDDEGIWIKTELEDSRAKRKGDIFTIVSTYLDNPFLPENIRKNIEDLREADPAYWQIYGLGEYGKIVGAVFPDFKIVRGVPNNAEYIGYGLDFGFTNDPAALMKLYKKDDDVYIEQMIYQRGMTNQDLDLAMRGLGVPKHEQIIADCAEPKSIEELRRLGWDIVESEKGKDSVRFGINLMLKYNLYVIESGTETIKEFRGYKWKPKKDSHDEFENEAIGINDHAIDAVRYVFMNKLMPEQIRKMRLGGSTPMEQLRALKTNIHKAYK